MVRAPRGDSVNMVRKFDERRTRRAGACFSPTRGLTPWEFVNVVLGLNAGSAMNLHACRQA
jgi:hypothetical protein